MKHGQDGRRRGDAEVFHCRRAGHRRTLGTLELFPGLPMKIPAITIDSGLSSATPAQIVVLPILFESKVLGVLELASLTKFSV